LAGKLATIVDIISDKRVLVDGEHIQRQVIPIRRLQLTRQTLKVGRGARSGILRKIISKENVEKKYNESSLGKSFNRQQRRASLTDFERYKVLVLRRKLSKLNRAKATKVVKGKK
jgi:large subunit ribosomal protein L14e